MKINNFSLLIPEDYSRNKFKNVMSTLIYIFLLFFVLTDVAVATNYYVATWGNNSDTGLSIDHTWRNPTYAVNQADKGDIIYLINGTWYNEHIVFSKSGNSTHPITLTAFNGTPTLDGINRTDTTDGESGIQIGKQATGVSYINVNNLTITNYFYGIYTRDSDYINIDTVEIYNTSYIGVHFIDNTYSSLTNSNIHDNGWNSVMVQLAYRPSHNISITNNRIHDNPGTSGHPMGHGLVDLMNYGTQYSLTDINIIGNELYNAGPNNSAVFEHGTVLEMYNINISNNIVYNSRTLNVNYLVNSTVSNNTIYNNFYYGLSSYAPYSPKSNVRFIGNNIYNIFDTEMWLNINSSAEGVISENDNISKFRIDTGRIIIKNPIKTYFTIRTTSNAKIYLQFSDNKVFNEKGANTTYYYPDSSEYITKGIETVTITTYPMTARPTTDPATVTINSFNTSLPAGKVLANFTANTTQNNSVAFTMSTLTPGKRYFVKVGGVTVDSPVADYTGMIEFSHSNWPAGVFTVVEDASYVPSLSRGNAIGISTYVSQDPLPGANVTLYYQNGTSYGQSLLSGSDGSFIFSNIPYGNYYVAIDKQLYKENTSLIFNVNSTSTNIGTIKAMCYDVNGDTKIDVLDLNMILQSFNVKTGASYPSVDVNGDGVVDINDVTLVAGQIGE